MKNKYIKFYFLITQIIFTLLIPTLIGFLIGKYYFKDDLTTGILAVVGFFIGLISSLIFLYRFSKKDKIDKKTIKKEFIQEYENIEKNNINK